MSDATKPPVDSDKLPEPKTLAELVEQLDHPHASKGPVDTGNLREMAATYRIPYPPSLLPPHLLRQIEAGKAAHAALLEQAAAELDEHRRARPPADARGDDIDRMERALFDAGEELARARGESGTTWDEQVNNAELRAFMRAMAVAALAFNQADTAHSIIDTLITEAHHRGVPLTLTRGETAVCLWVGAAAEDDTATGPMVRTEGNHHRSGQWSTVTAATLEIACRAALDLVFRVPVLDPPRDPAEPPPGVMLYIARVQCPEVRRV